jgi:hypothetical protein
LHDWLSSAARGDCLVASARVIDQSADPHFRQRKSLPIAARRGAGEVRLRGALALLLALSLGACDRYPDYRYKMTVEVETPQGVRRYSTVRQVEVTNSPFSMPNAPGLSRKLIGEAVIMDLPGGSTVFALLGTDRFEEWPEDYALPFDNSKGGAASAQAKAAVKGAHELPRAQDLGDGTSATLWPAMVRFASANDPKSVVEVDPDALPGGARVRRIVIEITDERVTKEIEKRLEWLANYRDLSLAGNRYRRDDTLADNLRIGRFITDIEK